MSIQRNGSPNQLRKTSIGKVVDDIKGLSGVAVDFGGTKIAASRVAGGNIVDRVQVKIDGQAEVSVQISVISDCFNNYQ